MSAEQLIALEAAVAELGSLYAVARGFVMLQERAERELLPALLELGSKLRSLLRSAQLNDDAVDDAAQRIVELRSAWKDAFAELRSSATYRSALAALSDDDQERLAELLPLLLADVQVVGPVPSIYLPVSVSSGRRRAGMNPFLTVGECADRIDEALRAGIAADAGTTEWWEQDLPCITCARDPEELDTPVTLWIAAGDVPVTLFERGDDFGLLIFTRRLQAPMSVVLATEATDSWWETQEESYVEFRDGLAAELRGRGHAPTIVGT